MCKDHTVIEHFWLMQMLGIGNILRQNETLLFYIFCPSSCPKIVSAPHD